MIIETKRYLRNILFICFLFHVCLLLILQLLYQHSFYAKYGHHFFNDGEAYSSHARIISAVLTNKFTAQNLENKYPNLKVASGNVLDYAKKGIIVPVAEYQVGYISYFYSLIYSTFGYLPILINLFNILLNLFTGIIIFKICNLIFNEKSGCFAITMFLFNPISFNYTTTKNPESVYIFVIYSFVYSLFLLKKNFLYIFLTIIAVILIGLLKPIFFMPMLIVILSYLYFIILKRFKRIIISCGVLILTMGVFFSKDLSRFILDIFYKGAEYNLSYQTVRAGLNYNLAIFGQDYQRYTFVQWVLYFINSWYHMLFEPLNPNSLFYLLYYPFKVIFLFLCFFAIFGFSISLRLKARCTILLFMFFCLAGSIIAMGSGNVGTMLRHRDVVTPVVFIFASVFIAKYLSFTKQTGQVYQ